MNGPPRDTARDLTARFAAAVLALGVAAALAACSGERADGTAEVSAAPAQTIDNIGASGAWWVNDLVKFQPANRDRVAELLFGESGLRLSAYRYNIGGGGVGVTNPGRVAQTFQVSPGRYDWSRDAAGRLFLDYATKHQVPDLIGFVNSAPPAFTRNESSCGGSLVAGTEAAFAAYLADVVAHLAEQGTKLDYISPMNEPTSSFEDCRQEGMQVPLEQRDDVIRAAGAALAAKAPFAKVIADESNALAADFNVVAPVWLEEPGTAEHVAKLAHHTYDNPNAETLTAAREIAKRFNKPLWATEVCCFAGVGTGWGQQYDPTITSGLALADIIYQDFAVANDSAFHWWVALSAGLGCDPKADPDCATRVNSTGWNDGLIYYDPYFATNGNQRLYLTKRFFALGQFSRFVRPGAVRHPVTGAPSGVRTLAFQREGRWTVVVTNLNRTATRLRLRLGGTDTLTAAGAYRTSEIEDLAEVAGPIVRGDLVTTTLPPNSITTYLLD